jgi:putative isomerase
MSSNHIGRWGRGQILGFSALDGPTCTASDLLARTMPQGIDVVMPGRVQVRFTAAVVSAEVASDWCVVHTANGTVSAVLLDNRHLLLRGAVTVCGSGPEVAVLQSDDRTVIGSTDGFIASLIGADVDAAIANRRAWLDRMLSKLPAAVAARPIAAKVLSMMKGQVCAPEGVIPCRWTTPDRWPHRDAFLWDSAFHAVAWRHIDPAFALEQLAALLHAQSVEGFLPHRLAPSGGSDITQPPVLAWAAEQVLDVRADDAWLAWAYPRLARFLDWMTATRTCADGLMAWRTSSVVTCRCDESGWDNSPRFDQSPSPLVIDLNAFMVRECQVMARFAAQLGREPETHRWQSQAATLMARIDALLWDESRGIYADRSPTASAPRPLRSSAGFLPLVSGQVPVERVARLTTLLADPDMFGTAVPLPSVAIADQVGLNSVGDMWRGPVWININHQIVRGLHDSGQPAAAESLRAGTMAAIERWYERGGSIYEFYDPFDRTAPFDLPRKGPNDPTTPYHQVIHDFGWSATCWLDLACAPPTGDASHASRLLALTA